MVPSLTVKAVFGGIRRVDSGVLAVSGTVPTPVASEPAEEGPDEDEEEPDELDDLEEDEDDDPVELAEDEEPADWLCCSAFWMAAVRAVLVRDNARWLAMLARPCDKLVIAELMTVITAALLASD